MTKSQLIKQLALKKDISTKDSETIVNTVFEEISASLEQGRRVELRGFGSFGLKERKGRVGRNPKTGESVKVDPKRVMFFKAGKELRERVDG
jgi:integration host factor subunit beta